MITRKHLGMGLALVLVSTLGCTESKQTSDQTTENPHQVEDAQGTVEPTITSGEAEAVTASTESIEPSTVVIENTYTDQYGNIVYTIVDQKPSFEGGKDALYQFLEENLKYPQTAITNEASGTVHVAFVVGKDGAIRDVELYSGVAEATLNKEAMRVVSAMPNWVPGQQEGKEVDVKYTIPIKFKLQ